MSHRTDHDLEMARARLEALASPTHEELLQRVANERHERMTWREQCDGCMAGQCSCAEYEPHDEDAATCANCGHDVEEHLRPDYRDE